MDRKTAMAAAAAVTMAVAGGVSGLFLTVGSGASASTTGLETEQPAVTVEYVDQDGNPVADPATTPAAASPEADSDVESVENEPESAYESDEHESSYQEADHEEDDYEDGDEEHEDGDDVD